MQAGDRTSILLNMLGTCYYNLKSYDDCINTFKLMEESNTASETSYYFTAMSYKALKKQEMAVLYFDKAIKEAVSPNVNSYFSEMADSYENIHRLKQAVNAYQKSLLYGALPLTYYQLANLYDIEFKKRALAIRYFRKYVNSSPPQDQRSYLNYSQKRIKELSR